MAEGSFKREERGVRNEREPSAAARAFANFSENAMKVTYDRKMDILRIILSDSAIEESDEEAPGVIVDYDDKGCIAGLEILDASTSVSEPQMIEYSIIE